MRTLEAESEERWAHVADLIGGEIEIEAEVQPGTTMSAKVSIRHEGVPT